MKSFYFYVDNNVLGIIIVHWGGGGNKVAGGSLSGTSLPPSQSSLETASVEPFHLEPNQLLVSSTYLHCISSPVVLLILGQNLE